MPLPCPHNQLNVLVFSIDLTSWYYGVLMFCILFFSVFNSQLSHKSLTCLVSSKENFSFLLLHSFLPLPSLPSFCFLALFHFVEEGRKSPQKLCQGTHTHKDIPMGSDVGGQHGWWLSPSPQRTECSFPADHQVIFAVFVKVASESYISYVGSGKKASSVRLMGLDRTAISVFEFWLGKDSETRFKL